MTEAIKKRLAELERLTGKAAPQVVAVLPDGSERKTGAAEWWEHRREWGLAPFERQDNTGGLVVLLMLAAMFDAEIDGATGEMREYVVAERDKLLEMYWS